MLENTSKTSVSRLAGACCVVLSLLVASCSGPDSSPPQQVQASNPTVTYQYRGDEELIKAGESADVYCAKYQASAHVQGISDTQDGSKSAVFQCVSNATMAVPGQALSPGQSYPYATDQDLLDRSRNADAYCASVGSHHAAATVAQASDGTKTVAFSCTAP